MLTLEKIRDYQKKGAVDFSLHATERAEEREIDGWDALEIVQKEKPVHTQSFIHNKTGHECCKVYTFYQDKPIYVSYYKRPDQNEIGVATMTWCDENTSEWPTVRPMFQAALAV